MPDFSYGDYPYLNDTDEMPNIYHKISIHNNSPYINIMSPNALLTNYLIKYLRMYFEKVFFRGYNKFFTLLKNGLKLMCGTIKFIKRKKCIFQWMI